MQKISYFVALILLVFSGNATVVTSHIKSVKVYTQGAEISRTARAALPAGTSEVVITGLPDQLDPGNIQVSGTGIFSILSVSHRLNHQVSAQHNQLLTQLQDSLDYYKNQLEVQQGMLKVYEEEEALLLANRSIGGSDAGVKVADLRSMADFFRSRLGEVKRLQLETRRQITQLQDRHNRVRQQLVVHSARGNQPVGELVITTQAPRPVNAVFEFSYITWQAGWQATYDVRAENTDQPIELLMKAMVQQTTGEDWTDVALSLSTGNPRANRVKPELHTWFLRFVEPVQPQVKMDNRLRFAPDMLMEMEILPFAEGLDAAQMPVFSATESQLTTEYAVNVPFTISSGQQPRMVEVERNQLQAHYRWFAAPRIDREVFLLARVTGWESLIPLPGEANLFFEGSFVGKSFIDPASVADTLELSMGVDKGVVIERNRLTDFSRKSILGRRTTETVAWEIVVRNNRNRRILLEIKDQIPVATHADMQITLEEQSGARFDSSNGMLYWNIDLGPNEIQRKIFRYSVRYPSDRIIRLE
ncbi:MAG: DUF4139 domain-containing protein [Bacteroidales bacterium]